MVMPTRQWFLSALDLSGWGSLVKALHCRTPMPEFWLVFCSVVVAVLVWTRQLVSDDPMRRSRAYRWASVPVGAILFPSGMLGGIAIFLIGRTYMRYNERVLG